MLIWYNAVWNLIMEGSAFIAFEPSYDDSFCYAAILFMDPFSGIAVVKLSTTVRARWCDTIALN